ncbi:MAG: glycosyltransferase family 2 protein [Lachnospiraceae bacterium]|jgi:glycosyltransferase involved in cell wall biosynthesis|nr:glycosyltransferase family 2 protein [Lachnospiraceae bacterium]
MDEVAVLIPCYNEEKTIAKVVADALAALPGATIYVYDNNSGDRTVELAQAAGAVVRREYMQGKGNVIRRMFREVEARCYVMVDGDDTYPMEYAAQMVRQVLERKVDMVIGDRLSSTYFTENKRPFHNMGNSLVRGAINRLFRCKVKDIMTGFRAFSYGFVKTFPVLSKGFEIETEMTIHAVYNNMMMANVVVDYRDRPVGSESKLNTYLDGIKVLNTIVKLYKDYKPFGFFTALATLLAVIALIFFVPIFIEYWRTRLVLRFPTLIVCGFIMMAAVQSFFAGLILSNLAMKNRRDFEYRYNQVAEREERSNSI